MFELRRVVAFAVAATFVVGAASVVSAQEKPAMSKEDQAMMEAMMKAATPGPNHKVLASMVGDWSFVMKMWMDPSAPPDETKGTVSNRSLLGGRYVQGEFKAPVMGMPFEGIAVNGYDNVTQQFVSTWLDNMSTGIMFMTGSYDPATKSLTYLGEMADPTNPSIKVKSREVIRLVNDNQHVMEMYETRGAKETKTMEVTYTRVK